MRKIVLFVFVTCLFESGICQNKKNQEIDIVSHTVQFGETVRMISRKYFVDPTEIYKLNKFAVDGVSQGQVLQIPVPKKNPVIEQEESVAQTLETVQSPGTTNQELDEAKPKQKARKVKPTEITNAVMVIDHDSLTEHTVMAGETLYSLSRQYGISVDEIKMSNGDALKKGLKVGQVVKIPGTKALGNDESSIGTSVTPTSEAPSGNEEAVSSGHEAITHEVAPKETLYSLSKKYNVTVDDIKSQNPEISKHGLQIGQKLIIRTNK